MLKKVMQKMALACIIMLLVVSQTILPVNAMTVYESDGVYHKEGYIIIGESHCVGASTAVGIRADVHNNVFHLANGEDISYKQVLDSSLAATKDGKPNTFIMKGNLFFVFEGNDQETEGARQISNEYVYSDGNGVRGGGVQKIHDIIDMNPNIEHWNIISIHGGVAASKGSKEVSDYFADSYRNWVTYEFPDADCYFVSVATMTKFFKGTRDKHVFNNTIQAAFPDAFLDYTDFYNARCETNMVDITHWDGDTYAELVTDIILNVAARREAKNQGQLLKDSAAFRVTEVQAVLGTNERTVIYEQPSIDSNVLLPFCETGIPVQVTGITDNGFFRVCISPDGTASYIAGDGLTPIQ